MSEIVKLNAKTRENAGTGSARALRRNKQIPAIIYGGTSEPLAISIPYTDFVKEYQKGGIKTRPVELSINNKEVMALVHEIQLHPVTDNVLHLDFLRVGKDTQIKVKVAVHVTNEDKAPGVKKGGVVNIVSRYVDLMANPLSIPHFIEVDVAGLEIGQNIHINDIKLPEGVSPYDKSNFTVVSITGRSSEEETPAAPATAT